MKYRKKPVIIEAIQWTGLNLEEIKSFVGESLHYDIIDTAWEVGKGIPHVCMSIKTLEGDQNCTKGDYIIKGVKGEFYPCKPDIFKETYDMVINTKNNSKSNIETTDWLTRGIGKKKLQKEKEKVLKKFNRNNNKKKIYKITCSFIAMNVPIDTYTGANDLYNALRIFYKNHKMSIVNIINCEEYIERKTNDLNITSLAEWLLSEKYSIDENDETMTEEFEKEHQWELSKNCFINKIIRHLENFK